MDHPAIRARRPGIVPTVAAAAFIALTVSLGNWQARRAEEKTALARDYDRRIADAAVAPKDWNSDDMRFRRVRVQGEFESSRTVFIDNRVHRGAAGYHVVTPLRLADGARVLVNRGWIAAGPTRAVLPAIPTPAGMQEIEGVAVLPPARVFEVGIEVPAGPVRLHLMPGRLAAEWKVPVERFVVEQTSATPDGLMRDWERPDTGADKHRAYSLQWYSFAVLTIVLFIALSFRRVA